MNITTKNLYKKYRNGCERVLVFRNGKYKIVAVDNPLNLTPVASSSTIYGTAIMETMTVYRNARGEIGIALLNQRLDRFFSKSIRLNEILVTNLNKNDLRNEIINYVKKESTNCFKTSELNRATLRLCLIQGVGNYGIGATTDEMILSVEMVGLPNSTIPNSCSVLIGEFQRNEPFAGKRSYHYANGVRLKNLMNTYKSNSIVYFSNVLSSNTNKVVIFNRILDIKRKQAAVKNLVIADMIGAEVFAINSKGELIYPPFWVNRLGGVTLDFIINKLAPNLGVRTVEQTFSIKDIENGNIVELALCGNNAEITPINFLKFQKKLHMKNIKLPDTKIVNSLRDGFYRDIDLGSRGQLLTII